MPPTSRMPMGRLRSMSVQTIKFTRVQLRGVRRWTENGKRRQQTKVFEQTINPFNKNTAGFPKSRSEIIAELQAERTAWLAESRQ
jgi:hypothetical protein